MIRSGIVRYTRQAENDLIDIWLHVAADNSSAADALLDDIDGKIQLLGQFPDIGPSRSDIAAGLRYLPVGHYLILYRKAGHGIEVVRVVHGARLLDDLL